MAYKARVTLGDLKELPRKEALFVIEYVKDCAHRRAAEAAGYDPDQGIQLLRKPEIAEMIDRILQDRLDNTVIDSEWVQCELVDNHRLARLQGNLNASTNALKVIANLAAVDAMARNKVDLEVTSTQDIVDRLKRGRQRVSQASGDQEEVSFF